MIADRTNQAAPRRGRLWRKLALRIQRYNLDMLVRLDGNKGVVSMPVSTVLAACGAKIAWLQHSPQKGNVQIPGKFFTLELPPEPYRVGLYLYYGSQYAPDGFFKADTICKAVRLDRNQVTRCFEQLRDAGVLRLSKGHIALYETPIDRAMRRN